MKTITRTMRADQLPPIFDIPEDMRHTQVNVIVVPVSDKTQTDEPAIEEAKDERLVFPDVVTPEAQRIAMHKFLKEMRECDDEPLGEEFDKILAKRVTFKRKLNFD